MFGSIVLIAFAVIPIVLLIVTKLFLPGPEDFSEEKIDTSKFDSKILVDLSECEICSSAGSTVHERTYSGPASILPVLDNHYRYSDISNQQVSPIQITYVKFKSNGHEYIGIIDKDPISAQVALMRKKTTFIYYNRNSPEKYFFDLEFDD